MADKTIGQLPEIASISDASLLPVQESGTAYHATGSTWKAYVRAAIADLVDQVLASVSQADGDASRAEEAAESAESNKNTILGMTVSSTVLPAGSTPTLTKTISDGVWNLAFGLAPGAAGSTGATGPAGPQGVQGIQGPPGGNAASIVAASGLFYFSINSSGHLIMTYSGDETDPNAWSVDSDTTSPTYGHLLYDPDLDT